METATPFDLNCAVQQWHENLEQLPAFRSENLIELESHLRDSIAALQTHGLSVEEAFAVAARRIGKDTQLETEFGKMNGGTVWLDRALWMLIGIQVWSLVWGWLNTVSSGAVTLGLIGGNFDFGANGRTLPIFLFGLARLLALVGSLALCWWLIVRKGGGFVSRIRHFLDGRVALALTSGALCLVLLGSDALRGGSMMMLAKFSIPRTFGEAMASQNYASLFGGPIQTGGLIVLTLILARKKLRLSKV